MGRFSIHHKLHIYHTLYGKYQHPFQRQTSRPKGKVAAHATATRPETKKMRGALAPWPDLEKLEAQAKAEGIGRVRVRQHVNPLKQELMVPVGPLKWEEVFAKPSLPLALDIGCGSGRFLLALSARMPGYNFLGLDIRDRLIERANEWARISGRSGEVHFVEANATVSLASMLSTFPGSLSLVTIQFPDPHFKTRHKKRRVVQRELVEAIEKLLVPGGRVFLQSDVKEAVAAMRDEFALWGGTHFRLAPGHVPTPPQSHSHHSSSTPAASSTALSLGPHRCVPRSSGVHADAAAEPSRHGMPGPLDPPAGAKYSFHGMPSAPDTPGDAQHSSQGTPSAPDTPRGAQHKSHGMPSIPDTSAGAQLPFNSPPSAEASKADGHTGTATSSTSQGMPNAPPAILWHDTPAHREAGHAPAHMREDAGAGVGDTHDGGAAGHSLDGQRWYRGGRGGAEVDNDGRRRVMEWARLGWLPDNPLGIPTEREVATMSKRAPIYRVLLERLPS